MCRMTSVRMMRARTSATPSCSTSSARPPHRAQLVARPDRRPDAAVHQRRDEPVQGRLPGPGAARLHAGDDVAEVHARQRQAQRSRQRRAVAPAPHVLRDAGQLLVRRLLQGRRHPLRLDGADRGVGPAQGPAARLDLRRRRHDRRATTRRSPSGRASCGDERASTSSAPPTTSGRWARPARAAAAPRSSTTAAAWTTCPPTIS